MDWLGTPPLCLHCGKGRAPCAERRAIACTEPPQALPVGPSDLALLPYTSGTTRAAQGRCMHPHKSIMHNAVASALKGGWVDR